MPLVGHRTDWPPLSMRGSTPKCFRSELDQLNRCGRRRFSCSRSANRAMSVRPVTRPQLDQSICPASLTKVLPAAFRPRGTRKAQDAVLSSLRFMHL